MKKIIFTILFPLLLISTSGAGEPIPYKDFVEITNGVLDALDKVEVVFGESESMQIEAKLALKNLKAAQKKYDRYGDKSKDQIKIMYEILMTTLQYEIALFDGHYGESHKKARDQATLVRQLFIEYKSKNKK